MEFETIMLFFIYTWGLGFSISQFFKNSGGFFERNIMRIGIGLGMIPLIGVLLDLFHLPVDWKIFLLLSLLIPIIYLFKNIKNIKEKIKEKLNFKFSLTKSHLCLIVVFILFFFTLFMYLKGAFGIPFFEDDDPWGHAKSIKYISIEKTLKEPYPDRELFHYIDSYPPGFDLIMGVLHQTSDSVMWTLKFFNSLIISLGILFFYFFALQFTQSKNKALIATVVLTAIPSYLSHFIWSHALTVTLFIPAFYCLEKISEDKRWFIAASLAIAGIFLSQPTTPIKFAFLFFIYYFIKVLLNKKLFLAHLSSFFIGLFLSLAWWIPTIMRKGTIKAAVDSFGFEQAANVEAGTSSGVFSIISKIFHAKGTATRLYTFNDFFVAKTQNMINNPIGVGIFLTVLLIIGVVWILIKSKTLKEPTNQWKLIALGWTIFTFLGIHGCTRIPVCLFSFRFWSLFALFSALVIAEGFDFSTRFFGSNKLIRYGLVLILVIGILFTSFYQKYAVNTAPWGPGGQWTSSEELQGYIWLKTLNPDTKVYAYDGWDAGVIGFDKMMCGWCENELRFKENLPDKSIQDIHQFLKANDYEYFIINGMAVRRFKEMYAINDSAAFVNQKVNEALNSGLFSAAYQNQGVVILRVL